MFLKAWESPDPTRPSWWFEVPLVHESVFRRSLSLYFLLTWGSSSLRRARREKCSTRYTELVCRSLGVRERYFNLCSPCPTTVLTQLYFQVFRERQCRDRRRRQCSTHQILIQRAMNFSVMALASSTSPSSSRSCTLPRMPDSKADETKIWSAFATLGYHSHLEHNLLHAWV